MVTGANLRSKSPAHDVWREIDALRPHARGPAFERLIRWWLTADPVFAARLRRAWLWSEWPDRWGPDAGIDIVAATHAGELWAVQTKAYDVARSVTKAGIDSFLSESNRPAFVHRLLVCTTDRLAPNALRAIHGQEKSVGVVRRVDLHSSAIAWPISLSQLDGTKRIARARSPRPHQRAAIAAVSASLLPGRRGQLLMACGTGKTLTALWIAERLKSQRTLVLVPTLSLLEQTMREWLAEASGALSFIAVCSDETVVREHDEPVAHTVDLGVPVTTNATEVRRFLASVSRCLVFATYQSTLVVADAQQQSSVPAFHLAIADEAHRCAGSASSPFAAVLDDRLIRSERRLFMTATPRYFTGRIRRQARQSDLELVSMDDEKVFGPVLHRLSFGEAIGRGLLSDYRVIVTAVDHSTYGAMAEQAALVEGEGLRTTDARTLAAELTVLRAMRQYDLKRVLTFHSRIRRAREFADHITEVAAWAPADCRPDGRLWASWVSGEMNVGDRVARLGRLRDLGDDERAWLANARCLSEGVDVPTLDGVVFIDPRQSQVDVVQAVGRTIRLAPDKSVGTIVIPVVIDSGDDSETVLRSSSFATVWAVVNALRAHDDELAEELDSARRQLGRVGSVARHPGRLVLDLPMTISTDFARAFDTKLIETTSSTWEFWFGLLESFVEQNGHAAVKQDTVINGYKLGVWVAGQRQLYQRTPSALRARGEKLTPERITRLRSFPGWVWSEHAAAWETALARLKAYVAREGSAQSIGERHIEEDGYRLGKWAGIQRTRYKRGELTQDQVDQLEAIPGWQWSKHDAMWMSTYEALLAYAKREGSAATIPKGLIEAGRDIGAFAHTARYKARKGTLRADRRELLNGVPGWHWGRSETQSDRSRQAM
jgi:predicted helicase